MTLRRIPSLSLLYLAVSLSSVAHAVAVPTGAMPGFYIGGQIGYAESYYNDGDFNSTNTTTSPSINNTGAGGRAYIGYQFNPYIGTELGYSILNNVTVRTLDAGGYSNIQGSIQNKAFDFVLKGTYPLIDSGFNIYVKAGGALLSRNTSAILCTASGVCDTTSGLFTYGGGFTYNILPHVPLDFSWTRIQQNTHIPNADLAAVGIGYSFG